MRTRRLNNTKENLVRFSLSLLENLINILCYIYARTHTLPLFLSFPRESIFLGRKRRNVKKKALFQHSISDLRYFNIQCQTLERSKKQRRSRKRKTFGEFFLRLIIRESQSNGKTAINSSRPANTKDSLISDAGIPACETPCFFAALLGK